MPERSDALVLFGATGDLARKKIYPACYHLVQQGELEGPLVGVSSSDWSDEDLHRRIQESCDAAGLKDPAVMDDLLGRASYAQGDYRDEATFDRLDGVLGLCQRPLYYLAIPPVMFEVVVNGLARVGRSEGGRVVVEKPLGRDAASARELDAVLHKAFPEEAIFRIDHFLGKEAVENIMVFRFANTIFEPIWNNHYVASVQVTMAETFGVEGRGRFYDTVGALRDVVQNHLLQMLALLAMEPPIDASADSLQSEKTKLLKQVRAVNPSDVVRGQYRGYVDEPGVAPGSDAETFAALRLYIDSWRWSGVPFLFRAGKRLAATATEAVVEFRRPPRVFFADADGPQPEPNSLRFRFSDPDGITLSLQAKKPGDEVVSRSIELEVNYARALGDRAEAYERLLGDAMEGSRARFGDAESIAQQWRIVEPALRRPAHLQLYSRGTWGPESAARLFEGAGAWYEPESPPTP